MNKEERNKSLYKTKFSSYLKMNYEFYLMLIPGIIFITIFSFIPLIGLTLAFKDYQMFLTDNPFLSIIKSKWVGLDHFHSVFVRNDFKFALRNTLTISVLKLVINFPIPIIFALLLNELRKKFFSRVIQLISYLPHFISWAVVSGIFISLLGSTGIVNGILVSLGFDQINFLMNNQYFRFILIFSDGWKEFGWSSIIYLAAITGLDMECYEAAKVDGASRFQQIIYITLPGISSTVILMLILKVGKIMNAGFEQILTMYNPTVYKSADIIDTLIYRIGLGKMDFSMGAAVGLFNSVIGLVLVLGSNHLAKKISGKGLW
jgi:putative aldouronate transport system permease protein